MSYKNINPDISEIKTGTPALKIGDKYVVGGIGGNFIPQVEIKEKEVTLGQVNAEGEFQPLAFDGTEASNSGNPETVENYYGFNGVLPVPDSGGGATGCDYYKCASCDTANKTWTGYKAVLTDGVYSFEETVTDGLTYGTGYKPIELNIYNADASINVNIYDGNNIVESGLIRYATLSKFAANDILGHPIDINGTHLFSVVDGVSSVFISGANNYIGYSTPLTLSSFTLSVWMKAVDTALVTFSNGYYGPDSGEVWIMLDSDTLHIANGSASGATIAELPADSGWHHCAVSWSGDTFILYLDGTKVESDPCSYHFEGAYLYAGSLQRAFEYVGGDGHYAALRMYDRVLEDNEIYQLANEFRPTI